MKRIKLCLGVLFLLLALLVSPAIADDAAAPEAFASSDVLELLQQQELAYDISFLWFDHLAEARFRFLQTDEPNTYEAVLEANTLGVAAWLTRDRVQIQKAIMTRDEQGRFHSREHLSSIYKGKGKKRKGRIKTYRYDFANRLVHLSVDRDGVVTEAEPMVMPEGPEPSDLLTTFMNFMAGRFGKLVPGETLLVPTFTKKGYSDIELTVLKPVEHLSGFPRTGLMCRVKVDQEVFDTGGGFVYAWFDERMVPAIGMVEDVLGMGDVRGDLRR